MEKLWTIILLLLNKNKKHKHWTRLVLAAAGIVVFFTTYALILPALTLEEDTAEDMPGIFLEEDGFFDDAFEPENDWDVSVSEPDAEAGIEDLPGIEDLAGIEDLPDEEEPGFEIPGESIWVIEGETEQITEEEDLLFGLEDAFPVDDMEDLPEDGFGPWLPEEDAEAYEEEYAEDYEEKYAEAYEEEDVEAFAEEYAETFAEEHEEEYVPVPAAETETETLEILEVILPRRNEEETNMNIYEQEEMFIDTQTEEAAETAAQAATEAATETVAEAEEALETVAEAETEEATETVAEAETEEATETVAEAETEEEAETAVPVETEDAMETAADPETEEAAETVREAETEELLGTLSGSITEAPAETETLMEAETESDQEILSCEVPVAGADYSLQIQYSAQAQIPEDAEFTASAVEQGEEYDRMGGLAIDTTAREEEVAAQDLMLRGVFDLHITDADGRDLQPEEDLSICVRFGDERDAERDFYAVSFAGVQTEERLEEPVQEEELSVLPTLTDEGTAQFEAGSASTYAIVGTTLEKTVLASDGYNYKITVSFGENTGIPEDTLLQVQQIGQETADEYRSQAENALGWEEGSVGYARFFDISIVDAAEQNRQYQPAEGSTVDVQIELEDSDSDQLSVVHFAGEEALPEVMDTAASQGTISFETTGFSVYAVVDAPEPVASDGWNKVSTLEEIAERGAEGVYIRHPNGFYFTNKQYNVNNTSRTGIQKTKPSAADPDKAGEVSTVPPALYYFEPVSGTENQFKVYCFHDNGSRLYIRQSGNSLSLTTSANATTFTISDFPGYADTFRMLGSGGYYWNMQGNDGGNGFAAWNSATDLNARMQLEYYFSQEDDPYGFNGKTYGLAFHNETATAAALTGQSATVNQAAGLAAEDMNMRMDVLGHEGLLLVSQGSDITEWTLTNVGGDRYHLTTEIDGQTKYLTINGANVTLESEPAAGSVITVKPGTGAYAGKVRFTAGDYSLCASQDKTAGTVKGFYAKKSSDEEIWLNFVEHSVLDDDDFTLYSAQKVSVSDTTNVYDTQQVIIYTRIWNDDAKRYEFYAVDHDGSLIRCYDTGDNIEWIGSKVNTALWNFTEYLDAVTQQPNYYYELQNEQYGNYLAPQMTGGQILSDNTLGINLQGRKYGKTYTTIVAWDDVNYAYVGLKTENGHVVACPLSEAEDFYFAVVNPVDDQDQLSTVETVDGTQFGITMKMVDFNNPKVNNRDSVQYPFFGGFDGFQTGLLSTQLIGDYPETTQLTGTVQSLGNLFTGMTDVNHLFIQSIYNESGYFEYDSTSNFAHLNENGLFTVYDQLGTMEDYNRPTGTHGQFMPYNDLTPGRYASFTNRTDVLGQELSDTDPRKGEKLYNIGSTKNVDYFFGMEMSASFTQTASGLDAWGHDIIFEFSGDDDFWLYVDGELVLDLGGVRSALEGSVNFRTGTVINAGTTTTLYDVFRNNYLSRGMTEAQINEKLDEIFVLNAEGNYVFRDYTNHTMKMFYMERGAGASNLHMRFNLAAVKPGTVMLSKKLSGTENPVNDLIEFPYQIWYQTEADISGGYHLLGETTDDQYNVKFEGTNTPVPFKEQFTPAGGTQSHEKVFFLKPGQKAEIRLPDGTLNYYIVECAVKSAVYDVVKANDIVLDGTESGNEGRFNFPTAADTPQNRPEVEYDNHVSEGAMRTLLISKKLYDEDGLNILKYPEVDTLFAFRLYLGTENADAQSLPLADMVSYFVKDTQGMYCRWNSGSRSFVSLGKTDYSTLTDEEKSQASFTTSMNGAISKIPAGYTIEVRDLIVGTQYKAEERKNEIPKGYTLRLGDGYTRVDVQPEIQNGTVPISGIIGVDEDPHIDVRNQKGWGLTVEKIWSDEDFMEIHDPIYFAVYYKNDVEGPGELIQGTVRQLKTTDKEVYYFFEHLDPGRQFSDYLIREVTLQAAPGETISVKDDGTVEGYDPDTVEPIENGGTLTIGGKPFGGEYRDTGYTYSVSYSPGDQTIHNENVRTDTVTNSRPGIVLEKTDWNGTPLSGAVFTLKDEEGRDVAAASYKSGSSGRITIAYLSEGEYTLTEISAPKGYAAVSAPIHITLSLNEETGAPDIAVSGIGTDYYSIRDDETGTMAAVITIRNRSNDLQVKKIDEETNTPISGVRFALYRQVTGVDGVKRKDYLPMRGYENLVTDVNGVLTQITMALDAGTYYLTETQAAENYELLSEDLCFTIGEDGTVSIETEDYKGWLQTQTDSSSGEMSFAITIPNRRTKKTAIRKVSAGTGSALEGAAFVLYRAEDYDDDLNQPKAGAQRLIQGSTDAEGMLQLGFLHNGEYRLVETHPPSGYLMLQAPVNILVTADGVTAMQSGASSEVTQRQETWEITVWNNPGYVLPSTGGPGTSVFYLSGILLAAIAISIRFLLARAGSRNI